ncbi:MAG: thiol-disulfide oxidoreductase DCC family protein [Chitinophagales bacterium]
MENNVVLFDGVCNLCNSSVQFIIKHDHKQVFKFSSLQSVFGQKILQQNNLNPTDFNSFIVLINGKLYQKSTGALKVAKQLNFPINLAYIFIIVPSFIRDGVYNFVAKNRYKWFGKRDFCMIPSPNLKNRFIE